MTLLRLAGSGAIAVHVAYWELISSASMRWESLWLLPRDVPGPLTSTAFPSPRLAWISWWIGFVNPGTSCTHEFCYPLIGDFLADNITFSPWTRSHSGQYSLYSIVKAAIVTSVLPDLWVLYGCRLGWKEKEVLYQRWAGSVIVGLLCTVIRIDTCRTSFWSSAPPIDFSHQPCRVWHLIPVIYSQGRWFVDGSAGQGQAKIPIGRCLSRMELSVVLCHGIQASSDVGSFASQELCYGGIELTDLRNSLPRLQLLVLIVVWIACYDLSDLRIYILYSEY